MELTKKVEKLYVKQHTNEWHMLRKKYIGASEIGTLLGINKFKTIKELLLEKLDFIEQKKSPSMILGSLFENDILEKFSYFEYDETKTYENYKQNRKLRDVSKTYNSYLLYLNDVPFIVSPDGYFKDEDGNTIPIETKFTNTFSINNNENNVSVGLYAWQAVFQQLLFNCEYSYIFTLIANTKLQLDKIELKNYISQIDEVINIAREFYNNLNHIKQNSLGINEINNQFYPDIKLKDYKQIKPELLEISSDDEQNYTNNNYIIGDEEDAEYASKYLHYLDKEREIKEFKNIAKTYFMLKYKSTAIPIISDIYKIKLLPKFNINIASSYELEIAENLKNNS